jgi:hypothetical protein
VKSSIEGEFKSMGAVARLVQEWGGVSEVNPSPSLALIEIKKAG